MARLQNPRHAPEPETHFTRNRVVVIGAALLAMQVAAALVWLAMSSVSKNVDLSMLLPIREVTIVGSMQRVSAAELNRVAGGIRGSMLRTDLNEVKAAMKQVHWVRSADVRRRFPGTLEVSIEEHGPFARWKTEDAAPGTLVNTFGEVFEAPHDGFLPVFSGPQGTSREVLAAYTAFKSQLASTGLEPAAISLSARRAWQIKLDNGTTLELGRGEAGERLARYVKTYPMVTALRSANARIDMRYQSGMALRVAEVKPAKEPVVAPKTAKKATTKT